MAPNLDIYGITKHRDEATINRFVEKYVDRHASEDRGDEELMLLHNNTTMHSSNPMDYDWEPALTLTHIIHRGLMTPRRAFTVYLSPQDKNLVGIILSFTADNQLVLGLSIDDEGKQIANFEKAKTLLSDLICNFECDAGLILVEEPPPMSKEEFYSKSSAPRTEFFI